jgi:hypothetical protein
VDAIQNERITEFDLEDVSVISTRDELPQALKTIPVDGIANMRIQKCNFDGHFVSDMLLYRNK